MISDLQLHPKYPWAGQANLSPDQIKVHHTLWLYVVCHNHEHPLQNCRFLANYKIEKLHKEPHPLDHQSGHGSRVKFSDLTLPSVTSAPGILRSPSSSPKGLSIMKPMWSSSSVTLLIVGKSPQMVVPTYAPSSNPFAVLASIDESSGDDLVSTCTVLPENPLNFVSSVITTQDMMHSLSHTAVTSNENRCKCY